MSEAFSHEIEYTGASDDKPKPVRVEPPEGMSRSAFKRLLKKQKFESEKAMWAERRKQKRKVLKEQKKKRKAESDLNAEGQPTEQPPIKQTRIQHQVDVSIIIDCGFDDKMKERERTSLGSQIVRCYSENKKAANMVNLTISSLNNLLLDRFKVAMKGQYKSWKGVEILHDDFKVPTDPVERENWIYLSSDSESTLKTLDLGKTYIIGGIVDKGRYKNLCRDKAESQNISTAKLPIDDYIRLSGRRVLTTNHVFEILIKWLECKDWKQAFESILPLRKLPAVKNKSANGEGDDKGNDKSDEKGDEKEADNDNDDVDNGEDEEGEEENQDEEDNNDNDVDNGEDEEGQEGNQDESLDTQPGDSS